MKNNRCFPPRNIQQTKAGSFQKIATVGEDSVIPALGVPLLEEARKNGANKIWVDGTNLDVPDRKRSGQR